MRRIGLFGIALAIVVTGIQAQVTNINIAGSYDGVFTLSRTPTEYKIGGSPYLSESWMYGTLELKKALLTTRGENNNSDLQAAEQLETIHKCNALIDQISDPEYRTTALKLLRSGSSIHTRSIRSDIELDESQFQELPGMIKEFEKKLISYLEQIKASCQANLEETKRLEGLFRYNLYAQEFEMVYNSDTFSIRAPLDIKSISLSNKKFIYGFYVDKEFGNEYLGSSYFEVISDGECKLLARHEVKIKDNSGPVTHSWASSQGDSFVKIRQLYFQKKEGMEVIQLKKNKKYLKEIFADRYYEVENYMRTEKINLKNENELKKLFDYYNNLDS
jgi:hypothetical protein